MIEVENILFDFNGTIIDDVDLCLKLLNQMLIKRNHLPVSKERYLEIFTFPVIEYYKLAGFKFPEDDFDELATFFINEYKRQNVTCPLYPNVIRTLNYLISKNIKLAIVSASEKNLLLSQLEQYGIKNYFFGISGLDSINADSKIESAKKFINKNNLNLSKTIFVGDTLHDADVALTLGIPCILIASGHQCKKVLNQSNAVILDDFGELINIIK